MKPVVTSMRALTMFILLLGAAAGTAAATRATIQDLSARQFKQMLDHHATDTDIVLLDIRTPQEFQAGHIRGAVLINYYASDFIDKLKALDREKTYLVYCRTGNRTGRSLPIFSRLGFQRVYHLETGISGWLREKYPVVR